MDRIRRLAARCLIPGFVGLEAPDWVVRNAEWLGGVALYGRNVASPEQVAALTASLHSARPGLLVAIDEEGGDVTRLEVAHGSSYPGNLALGAAGDVDLTRRVAAAIGADLAAAGVDVDFAPCADVNSNPDNPIIGVRSFGADATVVAAHTAAFVEGLQDEGVAATAKHFPGHGDTAVDSHVGLPYVDDHRGALEPFRAAVAAGVRCVMTAHIVVRPLDSVPATLSRRVVTDLLRNELGFEGAIVSDGIEMAGVSAQYGLDGATVAALAAGVDAICVGGGHADEETFNRLADAIAAAVAAGTIAEERLVAAAAAVDRLAEWRAAQPPPPAADRSAGLEAARRAIAVEGDPRLGRRAFVVEMDRPDTIAAGRVGWGLAAALSALGADLETLRIRSTPDLDSLLSQAAGRSLAIVVRDTRHHPWQTEVVARLVAARPDAVVVDMGYPGPLPAGAAGYVSTLGAGRVNAVAAAEVMLAGVGAAR